MHPIIFLDIDGVLINGTRTNTLPIPVPVPTAWDAPDAACVKVLNTIIDLTGADIVVSSCWRVGRSVDELRKLLERWGVNGFVLDRTGVTEDERGNEILSWLKNRRTSTAHRFVILDDNSDMGVLIQRLVRTESNKGLQEEHVEQVLAVLRRQGWKP